MQNAQSAAVLHTSTLVAVISVFLLDSFTPVGMVDWLLYIVPVFMASRAGASAFLYLFLSLVFSCLIAGHYSSGGHDIQNYDLFNRIAGFLVIISLGFISRKQFEVFGKLKIGESRFRKLADSLPQLIWTATPEGTLDYFNERYHDFSGIVKIRENHWNHRSLVFEDDVKKTADTWANAVKEGRLYQQEHRFIHKDGSVHWYFSHAVPVRDDHGKIIKWYGFTTNIDKVKESELLAQKSKAELENLTLSLEQKITDGNRRVRELSKELTIAEQRERIRFSQTLHDELLQTLFSAKMHVDVLCLMEKKLAESADVSFLKSLVSKSIYEAKSLVLELNPPILKSEGLEAAIQWLACHMSELYGLEINLDIREHIVGIKETDRILIVQLLRELLFNILKHAGTKNVWISAQKKHNLISIAIKDNGIGFDSDALLSVNNSGISSGLLCVKERLRLFGGSLSICSKPHIGTVVTLLLPVETDLVESSIGNEKISHC